jgi:hypothetical protein
MACFQGWQTAGLGNAGRRADVTMEREKVRGIEREIVRRDNIMMVDDSNWRIEDGSLRKSINELT